MCLQFSFKNVQRGRCTNVLSKYCFALSARLEFLCVRSFRPPLRQFLMDGDFFIGAALATTLTKLALRYVTQTQDKRKQHVRFFKLHVLTNIMIIYAVICDILYLLDIG